MTSSQETDRTYSNKKKLQLPEPARGQSACRWLSHKPSRRLSLFFARPAVTFSAVEHHRPLARTNLNRLVTKAHVVTWNWNGRESNPRPLDRKSKALIITPPRHAKYIPRSIFINKSLRWHRMTWNNTVRVRAALNTLQNNVRLTNN